MSLQTNLNTVVFIDTPLFGTIFLNKWHLLCIQDSKKKKNNLIFLKKTNINRKTFVVNPKFKKNDPK